MSETQNPSTPVRHVKVGEFEIGNDLPFTLLAGPCAMESREHALDMAGSLKELTDKLGINFIYKTSFDKANRTSIKSNRGFGLENALPVFDAVRSEIKVPVITDVHTEEQCRTVAAHVDLLQIPAFLCRQTDLLVAAAQTGLPVNVKKGQFLAPWDMKNIVEKFDYCGNPNVMLCERGVSFGYNTLVNDMRALPIMAETGCPVVFDATHSVQQPGGKGTVSGGDRRFVPILARGAVAIGVAAVFMETHRDPDSAPSDGPNMVQFDKLEPILEQLLEFDHLAKAGH